MSELSGKNFGIIIAYVLPGFVTLWGVSHYSPTVESWLTTTSSGSPTVAGFMYVTLASLGAGLTVSAVRWCLLDSVHHATGIEPPPWEFANLDDRLQGFLALVENHYRYYQFYGNTFVAMAIAYRVRLAWLRSSPWQEGWWTVAFMVLEAILLAGSRDALRKYYSRAARLLRNSKH
jgi:hypothetical protein